MKPSRKKARHDPSGGGNQNPSPLFLSTFQPFRKVFNSLVSADLPVNASSFDVEALHPSSGGMTALLRCRGSYAYFSASADPSGFDTVDFHASRVFMSASRLDSLRIGDTLHADFHDGDVTFTLERGEG